MAKAKKIRREIEIGGVKRWISGNTEQEYAENLIQALRGETDNQAQFIPPPRKDGGQQKRRMARQFPQNRLYNKSWGKEQKSGQSKPNQVKWKCKDPQPEEGILCPRKIIAQNS